MLNVKKDLDPFEFYDMKTLPVTDEMEEIQSTRIKLAVLKAQNKLNDEDDEVISQAEHDLDQVMGLETYNDPPKARSFDNLQHIHW